MRPESSIALAAVSGGMFEIGDELQSLSKAYPISDRRNPGRISSLVLVHRALILRDQT